MGLLDTISQTTGLPKAKVLKYSLGFLVLFVVFGIGQAIITNLIGVAYPVFMSFHALESKERDADDKQWLTYWVIFSLFSVTDQFAGFILHFIPFYYVLKVATLIWLFHPAFQGASYVYRELIHPYVEHLNYFEKQVQDGINSSVNQVKSGVSSITGRKFD
jgi:receptor expression-enhancing protein 5/6